MVEVEVLEAWDHFESEHLDASEVDIKVYSVIFGLHDSTFPEGRPVADDLEVVTC